MAEPIGERKRAHLDLCEQAEVEYARKTTLLEEVELVHDALPELTSVATAAADAVARGDAATLLDAVDRSAALLVRLGNELDLPLVTPALATLVRTANRVGAAAKPSGAGAGDCGIALATSAAQAAAVRAAWQDAGILPLPVQIAECGVTVG